LISGRCSIPAEAGGERLRRGRKWLDTEKQTADLSPGQAHLLVSRNLVICGRKTTVCLEDKRWESLNVIAEHKGCSVQDLCSLICEQKTNDQGVSSAIRMFLMLYYRDAATEAGDAVSGHFNQKPHRKAAFIKPLNFLKAKVGHGGLNEEILTKAEAVLENNAVDFLPMAETCLASLMRGIKQARNHVHGEDGEALIARMLEPATDLKAGGAMCGYPLVARIADKLIQFLEAIAEPDKDAIEIVLAFHTTIRAVLTGRTPGFGGKCADELVQTLEAACLRYFEHYPDNGFGL
jgi:predicted DNA-binding ribbon-helix-helix protein